MKHKVTLLLTSIISMLLLTSIALGQSDSTDEAGEYQTLTIEEFADILDHHGGDYTIVNVHIPYQGEVPATDLHIPYNDIEALTSALPDKDAPIILYCRSGSMSAEASQVLSELGYTQIWDVSGGMNSWVSSGRELLSGSIGSDDDHPQVTMPHIHGLGFSADGRQLYVPAHSGFRIYEDGKWVSPDLPAHDYMGYSSTNEGFYSSGHPGAVSNTDHPNFQGDLINPLGLVKSEDNGETLITLDFAGESDFHLMAAGYENHAVYVFNPQPNSELGIGLFYTLDDGETWQQAQAQGISAVYQLAVHPTEPNIIAAATETGLYLSDDYGNQFRLVGDEEVISAVAFDPQLGELYFGYQSLYRYEIETEEIVEVAVPDIPEDDGVIY
ncbi:MAG: hypothetical protein K8I82_24760, partial [Anaerolineae bacterium]|nr:hypothetical protein [Anaerolineae bacterium]